MPSLALVAFIAPWRDGDRSDGWADRHLRRRHICVILVGRYRSIRSFASLPKRAREVMTAAALLVVLGAATPCSLPGFRWRWAPSSLASCFPNRASATTRGRHRAFSWPFARYVLHQRRHVLISSWSARNLDADRRRRVGFMVVKSSVSSGWCGFPDRPRRRGAASRGCSRRAASRLRAFPRGRLDRVFARRTHGTAHLHRHDLDGADAARPCVLRRLLPKRHAYARPLDDADGLAGTVLSSASAASARWPARPCRPRGIEVSTIDYIPKRSAPPTGFGFKVYYGEGTRLDVLRAVGARTAKIIALCIDDRQAVNKAVNVAWRL